MTRLALTLVSVLLLSVTPVLAQDGAVRVTTARANVRSDASEAGPVLAQVATGTTLTLKAVVGDWFQIELPPDPRLGGVRVQGFISRKVATVVTEPRAVTADARAASAPADSLASLSVTLQDGGTTVAVKRDAARLRAIDDRVDSVPALAGVLPMNDVVPIAQGAQPVTYVWTIAGRAAERVLTSRRPTFVVLFTGAPGFAPADLTPVLVRLTPALSGVRILAAVRARADQAQRTDADWDTMKDFKQETVRATVALAEPGAARLLPSSDLAPGEYAVVLRPAGTKKLSGPAVLGDSGGGSIFTAAWTFGIK